MGRKKTLPTDQKVGHWRPRWRAAAGWEGEVGGGKSTRRAGTPMKDWVIAFPTFSCQPCSYVGEAKKRGGKEKGKGREGEYRAG